MQPSQSKRKFTRHRCQTPIQFLYRQPDRYFNSQVSDYSEAGLHFRSMQPLEINSQIRIIMPGYSPQASGPEAYQSYTAAVRWCQKISDKKSSRFGVGVEILEKSHERLTEIGPRTRQTCDRCDASLPAASVCRIDGSICLCPDCFDRLEKIPEGSLKSDIKRILDGNVL